MQNLKKLCATLSDEMKKKGKKKKKKKKKTHSLLRISEIVSWLVCQHAGYFRGVIDILRFCMGSNHSLSLYFSSTVLPELLQKWYQRSFLTASARSLTWGSSHPIQTTNLNLSRKLPTEALSLATNWQQNPSFLKIIIKSLPSFGSVWQYHFSAE